ncbi:hypothetical protein AOQ73_05950 [Bradyrhizobium pachyrhizi]|uniref:hypothetical protein n=1 Tax=Bradyrhizobium pachyrhizi TaxID=280333 RepID=UPI0007051C97|nr:hypothetical protein [Bradyrhizobium pachyrhizi]KRQ11949.1 hypothetical protein AOQ73_05950 [Bradyrhizobium pachyrhizi]
MQGVKLTDEELQARVDVYNEAHKNGAEAARRLGIDRKALRDSLKSAAKRGLMLQEPAAWPGFKITRESKTTRVDKDGNESSAQSVTQAIDAEGGDFTVPPTHLMGKITYQVSGDGKIERSWPRVSPDDNLRAAAMREMVAAMVSELPRAEPVTAPVAVLNDKCNQYTLTDYHFGQMSWGEETGGADTDLKIQERLWCDWWAYAIKNAPDADTGILANIGDLVHFDGLKSVTPEHGHVLDSDSRFSKIVRTVIRCYRFAVHELLKKHSRVHLIFSDANHDPASEIWLRELFAAHFDDEPRVTVDRSPGSYNVFEWGLTSLFYHHGHKKKSKGPQGIDTTWVGRFREVFGRTKFSYGHTGHLHSDEMFTSNTGIKVERHETLAAPSSYEANAGYNSGRSAKVITYSKRFGECGRLTITPEMVQA